MIFKRGMVAFEEDYDRYGRLLKVDDACKDELLELAKTH